MSNSLFTSDAGNGKKARSWTRIGAAFPHKEGTGFNIDILYSVGQTRDITVIGFGKSELEDDLRAAAAKQGPDHGKRRLDDYTANRYHKPADEYSLDWDVSGTLQDLQLYYAVGLDIVNSSRWPNWYPGVEFRAIRDQSRK